MAKNNKLINSLLQIASRNREENVKAAADEMAPEAYAAFALVLYTRGWRHKRIEKLFLETQEVWNDYGERKEKRRMVELAEQLTGIRLLSPQEAEEAKE